MDEVAKIGDRVADAMESMFAGVTAESVFSDARATGDRDVITAAAIEKAGGFGFGGGGDGTDGGGGGGGGGSAIGRPVAVVELGPDGVVVHPLVDVTRLGIAVITTVLAMIRLGRRGR